MGGGSGLLLNSNRRGKIDSFGCDGWFCDVLNGAMTLLAVLIVVTAFLGCVRSCRKRKTGGTTSSATAAPQRLQRRASSSKTSCDSEDVAAVAPPPTFTSSGEEDVVSPPGYSESQNLPPAYSSINFDEIP